MPHKRPPAFTPHTKGRADGTDKGKPPLVVSLHFVCGVNIGGLLCGMSGESMESIDKNL